MTNKVKSTKYDKEQGSFYKKNVFVTLSILCFILVLSTLTSGIAGIPTTQGQSISISPREDAQYTTDDLQLGDYIENFGIYNDNALRWRVVGEDDNGKLLRLDTPLNKQAFSTPNANDDTIINQVILNGNVSVDNRQKNGTNFWEQADIRDYLNNDFLYNVFNTTELSYINQTPKQKQLLAWFDLGSKASDFQLISTKTKGSPNIQNSQLETAGSYLTSNGIVAQNGLDTVINSFYLYDNPITSLINLSNFDSVEYNQAAYYTISDAVFLPDLAQVASLYAERNKVKNIDGSSYAQQASYFLRTPFIGQGENAFVNTDKVYTMSTASIGNATANATNNDIYPHIYLSNSSTTPTAQFYGRAEITVSGNTHHSYYFDVLPYNSSLQLSDAVKGQNYNESNAFNVFGNKNNLYLFSFTDENSIGFQTYNNSTQSFLRGTPTITEDNIQLKVKISMTTNSKVEIDKVFSIRVKDSKSSPSSEIPDNLTVEVGQKFSKIKDQNPEFDWEKFSIPNPNNVFQSIGVVDFAIDSNTDKPNLANIRSSWRVTVTQATAESDKGYVAPTRQNSNFAVGDNLGTVGLPRGWQWTNPNEIINSQNSFEAKYTPTNPTNYTAKTQMVSFNATTKTIPTPAPNPTFSIDYAKTNILADLSPDNLPQPSNGVVGRWSWKDANQLLGNAGTRTFSAIFIPSSTNANKIIESPVEITINPLLGNNASDFQSPKDLIGLEGDKLSKINLPQGWSWDTPDQVISASQTAYSATFVPSDSNYGSVTQNLTISIIPMEKGPDWALIGAIAGGAVIVIAGVIVLIVLLGKKGKGKRGRGNRYVPKTYNPYKR